MIWKTGDGHNLGRWVQPTLSMVFWNRWAQTKSYGALALPPLTGDMALLDGHTIFRKDEYRTLIGIAQDAIENQDATVFDRIAMNAKENVRRHWELGETLKSGTLQTRHALSALFDSWHELCCPWTMVFPFSDPLEKALVEATEREGVAQEAVAQAVAPKTMTPLMAQNHQAQQLGKKILEAGVHLDVHASTEKNSGYVKKADPELCQEIQDHVKQYAWIGTHHLWGKRFDVEAFFEQIRMPPVERKKTETRFSNKLRWLIEQSEKMGYWRQYCAEASDMAAFWARPYLKTGAEKLSLSQDQIIWLLDTEILDGLDGKPVPSQSEIAGRQKAFGIVNEKGIQKVIVDTELTGWLDALVPATDTDIVELKGTAACAGMIEATACIAITPHDAERIQNGQVLVAPQTTPDFVPYMRRASAIVTDEGGLTCHAAIVSRELGKPCVVGTKVATRTIKQGERIRVDGGKGRVIRLEMA